jgi:hypothetical protein
MLTMLVLGAVLVVLGIAGSANACVSEDRNLTMALIAGLSFAIGCVLLAIGAVRRGYHYRPEGAPPGDMDPAKAELPTPDNPPTR